MRYALPAIRALAVTALLLGTAMADSGTVRIRIEARKLTLPDQPEGLHWVVLGTPVAESLSTPAIKAKVQQQLNKAKADASCPAPVAFTRSICNLFTAIEGESDAFTHFLVQIPTGIAVPPDVVSAPRDFIATVEFTEVPAVLIEAISVVVITNNWNKMPSARLGAADVPYPKAIQQTSLQGITQLDPAIITLQYSSLDRLRGHRKDPFTEAQVQAALLRAAIPVLHAVREKGVEPGRPTPPDTVLSDFKDLLEPLLQANVKGWNDPSIIVTRSGDRKAVTVKIENVRIVSNARINVDRGRIENEGGEPVRFSGTNPQAEREIRNDLQSSEQSLNRIFQSKLQSMEGTIPSKSTIDSLLAELAGRKELVGRAEVNGFDGNLIFVGANAWVVGKLDAKIRLNSAFTPEDLFTGEGSLTGERLLYNLVHRDLGDTYAFTLRGGPQIQSAEFVFGLPRSRGQKWVASYGADLTASYVRDLNQLIGALTRGANGRLTESEKGLMPRIYGELRRASEGSHWTLLSRAETLLDWRYLLLAPNWTSARFTAGQMTAPTLRIRQGLRYDRSRETGGGFGSFSVEFNGEGRRAITALAGDFDFRQYLVSGTIETFFGTRTRRDFRLRYRRGFGASSAGTPVHQLFRLGGEHSLFGIEEGEYIGRGIAFGRAEVGVSARWLWSLLPAGRAPQSGQSTPSFLDNVYLTLLYDRGSVLDNTRLNRLMTMDQPASGRGIAVELRRIANRANVTIGYARSSQSFAHRKGLMILGVGFDF